MAYWRSILCLIIWCSTVVVSLAATPAGTAYTQAKEIYTAAWLSWAAYDDRLSRVARSALAKRGWTVTPAIAVSTDAKTRYVRADKEDTTYIAIAGTASWSDVKADLNIHTVPLHRETPDDGIKVHSGFNGYSSALVRDIEDTDMKEDIILTGHSLGGAVAILTGARLVDSGTDSVKAITFGAPAVGNQAFQDHYRKDMEISPIVQDGDPVPTVLPSLVAAYAPLQPVLRWPTPPGEQRFQHNIAAYVDSALRHYYDAKTDYEAELGHAVPLDITPANIASLYVLPVDIEGTIPPDTVPYIRAALDDALQHEATGLTWASQAESFTESLRQAQIEQKDFVLKRTILGQPVKEKNGILQLTLIQTLYSSQDGHLVQSRVSMTNTEQMTPIEAALYMEFTNSLPMSTPAKGA